MNIMVTKKHVNIVRVAIMVQDVLIALPKSIDMGVEIINAVGVVQLMLDQDAPTVLPKSMKNKKYDCFINISM